MTRQTPLQWRDLIEEHAAATQMATTFCVARGIYNKYFSLQKNKLQRAAQKAPKAHSKFVKLNLLS